MTDTLALLFNFWTEVWSLCEMTTRAPIKPGFASMAAKEEMAHMNKLMRLLFGLWVSGVMSNTVWSEAFSVNWKLTAAKGDWPLKMIVWNEWAQPCLLMKLIVKDANRWPILLLITCLLFSPLLFRFKLFWNYCGVYVNSIGAELSGSGWMMIHPQVNLFFSGQLRVQM